MMEVGDKVKFVKPGATLTGCVGIIQEIRDYSPEYMVDFPAYPNDPPIPCGNIELESQ